MTEPVAQEFSDTLCIRISMNEISFAVFDPTTPNGLSFDTFRVKPTASLLVNLKEAIDTVPLAQGNYIRVRVLVQSATTIVPLSDFVEEDASTIFLFNYPERKGMNVFYDTLPHLSAVLLFGVDKAVCNYLNDVYPNIFYISTTTPVLLHFSDLTQGKHETKLFAYVNRGWMETYAFSNGKLFMVNHYVVRDVPDVVYYILFIVRLMKLNQLDDEVFVTGNLPERQQLISELRRYVANTFFINPSAEFNRHPASTKENIPYDLTVYLLQIH